MFTVSAPQVSVIIPTYSHRDYVLQTLDSVFAQTFKDYEVVVVNDGSPDDTALVLEPLRRARRIRYIEQPNAGQAAARNRGLAEARGEFIAFLDDDDLWPADKLEWQVLEMRERPELIMVAGHSALFEGAPASCSQRKDPPSVLSFESLLLGNPISSPGQALIRATKLKAVGGFSPDIWGVDDWDLWMRLSRCGAIEVRTRVALLYRLHSTNASKDFARMLKNADKVLARNLMLVDEAKREELKRKAYLHLYSNLGSQAVHDAKRHTQQGELSMAFHSATSLWPFAAHTVVNMELARRMIRDMLPRRLAPKAKGQLSEK